MKKVIKNFFALILSLMMVFPLFGIANAESLKSNQDCGYKLSDFNLSNNLVKDSNSGFTINDFKLHKYPNDSNLMKEKNSLASSGTDLRVSSLNAHTSEPFPNEKPIKFSFIIANVGTNKINNQPVSIQVQLDNTDILDTSVTLTLETGVILEPDTYVQGSFYITGAGGTHTVTVVALPLFIKDCNISNNKTSGRFKWADCVSLSAASLSTSDGIYQFESNQTKAFTFKIANFGTLDAKNVLIRFKVNDTAIKNATVDKIEAKHIITGQIKITFYKHGRYNIELDVDPNRTVDNINADNNSKTTQVTVDYDTEIWAGKWKNSRKLSVMIYGSAIDLINNDNAGNNATNKAKKAIHAWNGINSDASYGSIYTSNSDEGWNTLDKQVSVISYDTGDDSTIAFTALWEKDGDGYTEVNDVENDKCIYVKAAVCLNPEVYPKQPAKNQFRTITHEFGHVFRLAHPTCRDKAIMRQTWDPLMTYTIQPHDEYNLNRSY